MTALLVALGAAVGAPLRFVVAQRLDDVDHGLPWGTLGVNVLGSFLLGLLVGLDPGTSALALLGTGFCGGFTTYSAFAVQSTQLGARRGAAYVGLTVVSALALCALGFWIAS